MEGSEFVSYRINVHKKKANPFWRRMNVLIPKQKGDPTGHIRFCEACPGKCCTLSEAEFSGKPDNYCVENYTHLSDTKKKEKTKRKVKQEEEEQFNDKEAQNIREYFGNSEEDDDF